MAQGFKSKEEIVRESMNSPKKIDKSIEFSIPRSHQQFNPSKHIYKCSSCGKGFTTKKNYFQKSNSPLFQADDGYLPWCKECADKYYTLLCAMYSGNEEHAIEHFCYQADWVYEENPLIAARESASRYRDRSRLSHYAAKKNLNCGGRKTFIDTIKFSYENKRKEIIASKEDIKSEDVSVKASAIDRWGIGFTELDYKNLDEHYRTLKRNNPNTDANQEIFVRSLCNINMLMIRALQNGDSKEYSSLVDQYSKTFKQAGLRTVEEKDNSADECLGITLAAISQYTPEEYYKNKSIYSDFDGIGDYFERFVKRPLKNLMFGSNERDKEFCVKEDADIDEQ